MGQTPSAEKIASADSQQPSSQLRHSISNTEEESEKQRLVSVEPNTVSHYSSIRSLEEIREEGADDTSCGRKSGKGSLRRVRSESYRSSGSVTFKSKVSWMNTIVSQHNTWGAFLGYWQVFDVIKTVLYLLGEFEHGWNRNNLSPLYHTEALLSLFHTVAFNYTLLYLLHDKHVFKHLFAFEVFLTAVLMLTLVAYPYTGAFKTYMTTYQILTILIVIPDMMFTYGIGHGLLDIETQFAGDDILDPIKEGLLEPIKEGMEGTSEAVGRAKTAVQQTGENVSAAAQGALDRTVSLTQDAITSLKEVVVASHEDTPDRSACTENVVANSASSEPTRNAALMTQKTGHGQGALSV
mmetsp:Transcript_16876/g.32327  ORF Transcript_16876/g.32327 Transcript_16876/m.32327 type:complete len:352 (+) Transcript_16876:272-1327(+)|eukprot:CAMPEP_0114244784 /NCGR_PEP_ID=MMETSP0058-20121206/11529_1 /TAXON_ID=36894 /ORGANISM="Pyramimonas parkeae, CCMP726" /LENGTH=351 /DNA_ID=CAMNT_0001357757 /DNA_START=184 /DNA_END=1239 /DNA_ORIENTATION=+